MADVLNVATRKNAEVTRVWSTFTVKSFDETKGIVEGIASTPTTDRVGDVVEPMGANFKLPMPFLLQHRTDQPLGWVTHAKPTKDGIPVRIEVAKDVALDYIRDAWTQIKAGLVAGLSIGFKANKSEDIKGTWGQRFTEWDWLELSAVTIPANAEATIQTVKAIDLAALAKSGPIAPAVMALSTPVAVVSAKPKGRGKMNTREQISGLEAKRAANAAAMTDLMEKTSEEGRTSTTEEAQKFDEFKSENERIDADLVRWRAMETEAVAKAVPVTAAAGTDEKQSIKIRSGDFAPKPAKALPPGIGMARYVKAFAFARGNYQQAAEYAKQWDESTPEVGMALKAAISAGTTMDTVWAGPLVYAQDFPAAFLDYLRPKTIIGRIPGMQHVPFNIRYGIQDGTSTVAWVGQGAPKPVSRLTFTSGSLGFAKAAGIVVITQELARFSSPSAELKVRDDLSGQMVTFLDQQFIDPSIAAVANVSPASVTNGATAVRQSAAAWTTQQAVLTDVKAFLALFTASGVEVSFANAVWVTTPDVALSLSLLLNAAGTDFAFPGVTVNGGTFAGLPMIVSNAVPHSVSAGSLMVLVVPEWIYIADDGGIAIDQSVEASLQMDTAPTNNAATPTATTLVSMFQTNSIAIRVERIINWQRARAYGAGYIDNVHTS